MLKTSQGTCPLVTHVQFISLVSAETIINVICTEKKVNKLKLAVLHCIEHYSDHIIHVFLQEYETFYAPKCKFLTLYVMVGSYLTGTTSWMEMDRMFKAAFTVTHTFINSVSSILPGFCLT